MPLPSMRTKLLLALVILIAGVLSASAALAAEQAQPIQMLVTPAFQGYFKYGEWLPVWVSLENDGSDLAGEVQVKVTRDFEQITYAVPISLPAGARKRLPVYVLPNNFTHELKVDLVVDDQVLQTQKVTVQPQPNINYLIGLATRERGALGLLPGMQLPGNRLPVLIDISLGNLPERPEALRTLDCLILNDIDSSGLTPEQGETLYSWVQSGGRLVIGGGTSALQTSAGLPEELLPLEFNDLMDLENLENLARFANKVPIEVSGPFVVATGEVTQGKTLVDENNIPLIQEYKLGKGYVTIVVLDLSSSPFNAWTGTTVFWETLITPGAAYPDWMPPDMSARQMKSGPIGNALSNLPSLDLPAASGIAILLAIYIFLVGPVNYVVLRWRKRLQWAWISIPMITLIFSAMSFGLGYAKRGTDLIINKIAIIQAQTDGSAQISSYIGLFSPANQAYEIEVTGEYLLSPMSNYYDPWSSSMGGSGGANLTFVQGNPSIVRGLTVNQWSMQSFTTETALEEMGSVQADLLLKDNKLVGSITNQTDYPLTDIVVVLRPSYVRLGDLEPGETTEVSLTLGNLQEMIFGGSMSWKIYEGEFSGPTMGPPSRELEFKRMVLEAVLDQQYYYGSRFDPTVTHSAKELDTQSKITLLAWMDMAPPEVLVNKEKPLESANALFTMQLPYQISTSGEITVPAGIIPGLIAEMPFSGGTCGAETTSLWIEQGEAVAEFILPPEFIDIKIETLSFAIQTDGGWGNPPQVAIYNWENEEWQSLDEVVLGLNNISSPAENINAEGLVRLRLSVENQDFRGGACYYLGLGLKGNQ